MAGQRRKKLPFFYNPGDKLQDFLGAENDGQLLALFILVKLHTPSSDNGPMFERILAPDSSGLKAEYFADRELTTLGGALT